MTPPRITMRRLMAAVAALAVVLGLAIEVQRQLRRRHYLQIAEGFARQAKQDFDLASDHEDHASWTERADVAAWLRQQSAEERRRACYASEMEGWYRRAAARAWPATDGPPPNPR